MTQQIFTT